MKNDNVTTRTAGDQPGDVCYKIIVPTRKFGFHRSLKKGFGAGNYEGDPIKFVSYIINHSRYNGNGQTMRY